MIQATSAHILIDNAGVAWIDDTNVKVIEVVLDWLAYGWSPEEMHYQHPHLSLAQIHAALAYYYDHQVAIEVELQQRSEVVDRLTPVGQSPLRQRLRTLGKIS